MYKANIVEQARKKDMIIFLRQLGFTFIKKGGDYRCKEHPSFAVKGDRLSWYWHSKRVGGYGALDYMMKVEGFNFREAIESLNDVPSAPSPQSEQIKKTLILPERAVILSTRLFNYLCKTRGIDSGIISVLKQDNKLYEDNRGNIVFVGYDEHNKAKFACLRGTYDNQFRMDCAGSDKRYGFNISYGGSDRLYVFEAPIDALSHATLENLITGDKNAWRSDNRLSLSGTSDLALEKYVEINPSIKEIVLCLDNDTAGHEAAVNIAKKYTAMGFYARAEFSNGKDFNVDLIDTIKKIQFEKTMKHKSENHI